MAFGPGLPGMGFSQQDIVASATAASGVYAIYNAQRSIYFGESNDIQRRLLEHLNDRASSIMQNAPAGSNSSWRGTRRSESRYRII
jgi:hypothetical protein